MKHYPNEFLAEHAVSAWDRIQEQIVDLEEWIADPDSKVTRSAVAGRLQDLAREVIKSLKDLVESADDVLEDEKTKVWDECEESLGSEYDRVGIRERYAVALEILERDAGISETDLLFVSRQFDPLKVLVKERKRAGR